jgi:hypothetical protein
MSNDCKVKTRYFWMIHKELENAIEKHPDFVSSIIDPSSRVSWAESEARIKLRNSRGPQCADNILMEEVAEAFSAYSKGELDNALHEFAQVGAVAIRCMSFVMAEKLKRGNHG